MSLFFFIVTFLLAGMVRRWCLAENCKLIKSSLWLQFMLKELSLHVHNDFSILPAHVWSKTTIAVDRHQPHPRRLWEWISPRNVCCVNAKLYRPMKIMMKFQKHVCLRTNTHCLGFSSCLFSFNSIILAITVDQAHVDFPSTLLYSLLP